MERGRVVGIVGKGNVYVFPPMSAKVGAKRRGGDSVPFFAVTPH